MSAVPDLIYPETTGERPPNLQDHLNFQRALGRLAARDPGIYELLVEIRHMLKPRSLSDDSSIAERVREEMADGSPERIRRPKSLPPKIDAVKERPSPRGR